MSQWPETSESLILRIRDPKDAIAWSQFMAIYSFGSGCVFYAICTGRPPFRAESSYAVLRLITDEEPRPIREINAEIPDWLCSIISKLMSKQADERFHNADEVAKLFEQCLAHVQQPTTTPFPVLVAELAKSSGGRGNDSPAESLDGIRYPPISKFIAAAAFAFSLIFAGVLIVLELNKGTLTIESEVNDVPIRITQGDRIVERLTVSKNGETVRIAAGRCVVEVDDGFDGVAVEGGVTLKRGTSEIVRFVKTTRQSNDASKVDVPARVNHRETTVDAAPALENAGTLHLRRLCEGSFRSDDERRVAGRTW